MKEASNPKNFGFTGFFGIREGGFEVASDDLEKPLKRPATPVKEAIQLIVSDLSQTEK
ncbi:hypothetical protein NST74_10820 [Paenibacillus sp. FSL F4-0125]|uniref:hypothetical protein n=1 Tax=Paenibacillus sp. FSL F4-0125 TaxID=2954730 RepID=UPI0030F6FA60